jgi:PhnB protein
MGGPMAVKAIPDGHNRVSHVSQYLIVSGAERALEFYRRAFGAIEIFQHKTPDGRIAHAEVRIGA